MIDLLLEAERALSVGLLDRAETLYRQVTNVDPRNSIAVVGLARVALDRGEDEKALELARKAVAIDPENPAAQRMVTRLEEIIDWRGEGTEAADEVANDVSVVDETGVEPAATTTSEDALEAEPRPEPEAPDETAAEAPIETGAGSGDEPEQEATSASGGGSTDHEDAEFAPPLGDEGAGWDDTVAPEPEPAVEASEMTGPESEGAAWPGPTDAPTGAPPVETPAPTASPTAPATRPSAPPTYAPDAEPRRRGLLDRLFRRSG